MTRCDLVMPTHDGMEAIFSNLQNHGLPTIAISAYPQYLNLVTNLVDRALYKPFSAEELHKAVQEVLDDPHRTRKRSHDPR